MKKLVSGLLACILLAGCSGGNSDDKTIVVGASPSPHAEILEQIKADVEKEGYTLEIKEFTDYIQPNLALEEGSLDANYFQHITYLKDFNEERGTHLASAANVHYEPFAIYPGKDHEVNPNLTADDIAEGAIIAVPNDGTNEGRALLLLEQIGLIKIAEGAGVTASEKDIVENPKNVKILPLEAQVLTSRLPDVDYAVINGNYALQNKITDKACVTESADGVAVEKYVNVLAVKEGNENSDKIKALVKALTSQKVKDFMNEKYGISVVPTF